MEGSRLRLSGTGEGFATVVRTTLSGADSPRKVLNALQRIFPDAEVNELPAEPSFGSASNQAWSFENLSLATFLNQLHEQRILDTALDAMSLNMKGRPQPFTSDVWLQSLEKSLSLFLETALGGVFEISIVGKGLGDWLQAATWHAGRSQVPRHTNAEPSMDEDGESSTWI